MTASISQPRMRAFVHSLRDYVQLTKPRIVALLIFTTLAAMVVASKGQTLPASILVATLVGGSRAAGGASAINQWLNFIIRFLREKACHDVSLELLIVKFIH